MNNITQNDKPEPFVASGTSPTIEMAKEYARREWKIFPVHGVLESGDCTCSNPTCTNIGKHPITPNGFKDATDNLTQIEAWFQEHKDANIGIACGVSNLFVVDVDLKNDGDKNWGALTKKHGFPQTLTAKTGSGGLHYVFQAPDDSNLNKPSTSKLAAGIDIRAGNSYIVAAPSRHKSGRDYEWVNIDTPIAPLPDWIKEALTEPASKKSPTAISPRASRQEARGFDISRLAQIWRESEGQRHALTLPIAGMLAHAGWSQIQVEDLIKEICDLADDEEVDDRLRIVEDTFSRHDIDDPVTGYPSLEKAIGKERAGEIRGILLGDHKSPYVIERGKTYFADPENGKRVELINAIVLIDSQIVEDDGNGGGQSFYEMSCDFNGRKSHKTISADDFDNAKSFASIFGEAGITVAPRYKDHAKNAVRILSHQYGIQRKETYPYTGWRKIDGRTGYLHGGGFLTSVGNLPASVKLGEKLKHFVLPKPPSDARPSVRAALELLDLHPEATANALGGVFLSVLGRHSVAPYLAGQTGVFKSQLAAIAQSFFGKGFGWDDNLPAQWVGSSTPGLTALGFTLKDAVLVVDDFAPSVNRKEKEKLEATFDITVRTATNGIGGSKANIDGSERGSKPFRALLLSAGEDIPEVSSIRARMMITDIRKGEIEKSKLTQAQKHSHDGVYAEAMAGYIAHLSDKISTIETNADQDVASLREQIRLEGGAHSRTPTNVAELTLGWKHFLDYAEAIKAISQDEREELDKKILAALLNTAQRAAGLNEERKSEIIFMTNLKSLLDSEEVNLHRDDAVPGKGTRVGWIKPDGVYLNPEAAYGAVNAFLLRQGGASLASKTMLFKNMDEAGMIFQKEAGRYTIKRAFADSRVLWLKRELFEDIPSKVEEVKGAKVFIGDD